MNNPSEAETRKELIDPALKKAGWDVTNPIQVGLEIPVDGSNVEAWQKLEKKLSALKKSGGLGNVKLPSGISDYSLMALYFAQFRPISPGQPCTTLLLPGRLKLIRLSPIFATA